jgi:hypothetical protein
LKVEGLEKYLSGIYFPISMTVVKNYVLRHSEKPLMNRFKKYRKVLLRVAGLLSVFKRKMFP